MLPARQCPSHGALLVDHVARHLRRHHQGSCATTGTPVSRRRRRLPCAICSPLRCHRNLSTTLRTSLEMQRLVAYPSSIFIKERNAICRCTGKMDMVQVFHIVL